MKYNEAAEGVSGDAAAAPRHPLACAAAGCPLAGTISDATNGAGPWECAWHHFREPGMTADDVTRWIRTRQYQGLALVESKGPTQAALELGALVKRGPERQPGEDDA